jgi:hypothetical protein
VAAVLEEDKSICDVQPDRRDPLLFERLYWCGEYEQIVAEDKKLALKGYAERAGRFLVADALLKIGKSFEAKQEFILLEADPLMRSAYPVASILAMERLGRICMEEKDIDSAVERYEQFLTIWSGLDIPLSDHLSAKRRLAKLNADRK